MVTDHDAVESRLMTAPVPDGGDQDASAWVEARPENRCQRLLRVDAFAACVLLTVREDGLRKLVQVPHDDLAGEHGFSELEGDLLRSPGYDAGAVTVLEESWLQPGVARSTRPRDRPGGRRLAGGGARPRPGAVRERAPYLPLSGRHRGPGDRAAAPGHPARRHRTGAGLRLRLLRGRRRAGVGPGAAQPARPRRGLRATRTTAAAGSSAGAGTSTASSRTSSTRSTTTSRSPTGWPARAWSTRIGSPPVGCRPAGCCRARCSASARTGGARCVAEVPFVDVVTTMFDASIPLTITEWDEWGDPRRQGRLRLDARLLAVRQRAPGRRRGRTCWSPARCTTRG